MNEQDAKAEIAAIASELTNIYRRVKALDAAFPGLCGDMETLRYKTCNAAFSAENVETAIAHWFTPEDQSR